MLMLIIIMIQNLGIVHHKVCDAQCTFTCSPPADWLGGPATPQPTFPQLYMLSMKPFGMEYPFGQFGLAVLSMSPPKF